ncbi:MAG: isocitrate dehydrogenase kinase/phosphatase AceK regulatory subunit [Gemmatimonadales bacterium]
MGALGTLWPADRWLDTARDAGLTLDRLQATVPELAGGGTLAFLPTPFVRGRRAFLVGRLEAGARSVPLILAIMHRERRLAVDAVVTDPDEASMVFGFTRTYFHAALPAPRRAVAFLHSILPNKRIDELYVALGHHKHGKREFYQELVRTLRTPGVRFEPAAGAKGLVMTVFALPRMNVVFKVIKDRADPPKNVTRREVQEKYRFVFSREYGGRLADTQEFEDLALPRSAFGPELAEELLRVASETVRARGDQLVIAHAYTERQMRPLDLYLRDAGPEAARAAVLDFGTALKELAGINVFPGVMLAKNFGVTRHGRVVFYDYDEIGPLDGLRFRKIPEAKTLEDEMSAEPWFSVGEHDVFPEEFERFLRFPEPLHAEFLRCHGDLFTAAFWEATRARVESEGIREPAPYPAERRLDRHASAVE